MWASSVVLAKQHALDAQGEHCKEEKGNVAWNLFVSVFLCLDKGPFSGKTLQDKTTSIPIFMNRIFKAVQYSTVMCY